MNTVAISGSRSFNNYTFFEAVLDSVSIDRIVSGGAPGADTLSRRYAAQNGIPIVEFLPDYLKYGRSAPIIRNKSIVDSADSVIAFWDGSSSGTLNTIDYSCKSKKPVTVYDVSQIPAMNRSSLLGESQDRKEAWSTYLTSLKGVPCSGSRLKAAKSMAKCLPQEKRPEYAHSIVKEWFQASRYSSLSGKDNLFLVMPSSSGNRFPLALAELLKESFGGTVATDFGKQDHSANVKGFSGVNKIIADRSFTVDPDVIKRLQKHPRTNNIIVDDLVSTGATVDSLRRALFAHGIKTHAVCSLVMTSTSIASPESIHSFSSSAFKRVNDSSFKEKMAAVFHNSLGGVLFHLQRSSSSVDDMKNLFGYVNRKYVELSSSIINHDPLKNMNITSIEDIQERVFKAYSLRLPESVFSSVKSTVLSEKIPAHDLYSHVSALIDKAQSGAFTWSRVAENQACYARCTRSPSPALSEGDVVVRESEAEGSAKFSAYRIDAARGEVYLGSGPDFESLKRRVEGYSLCYLLKNEVEKYQARSLGRDAIAMTLDL